MDYTAQGHDREPGRAHGAACGSPTASTSPKRRRTLVGGLLRALRDLGPSQVKGVAEPVPVYELERDRRGAHAPRRVALPRALALRGPRRRDELASRPRWSARWPGNGQVVGVVAEAGTGKSRLCYEFVERCRARGMLVTRDARSAARRGGAAAAHPGASTARRSASRTATTDRTARQKVAGRGRPARRPRTCWTSLPAAVRLPGHPRSRVSGLQPGSPPSTPAPSARPARQRMTLARSRARARRSSSSRTCTGSTPGDRDLRRDAGRGRAGDAHAAARELPARVPAPTGCGAATTSSLRWRRSTPRPIREMLDDLLGDDPSLAGLANERIHDAHGWATPSSPRRSCSR